MIPWAWAVRNCRQLGPSPPRRRIDPGPVQDFPHRAGRDLVAQPGQFALDAPMPPTWIVPGQPQHQIPDRPGRPRPSAPAARIGPAAADQVPMPAQQRLRRHREDTPPAAWQQQPIPTPMLRPGYLPAQHRQLMPQHQNLDLLARLRPAEQDCQLQQPPNHQIDHGQDHGVGCWRSAEAQVNATIKVSEPQRLRREGQAHEAQSAQHRHRSRARQPPRRRRWSIAGCAALAARHAVRSLPERARRSAHRRDRVWRQTTEYDAAMRLLMTVAAVAGQGRSASCSN
jgi:hypothetical protein